LRKTFSAVVQQKHFLRLHYREMVRDISPRRRRRESFRAARRLASLPDFRKAAVVGLYLSLPHEMDTGPLIEIARRAGKAVLVPVVSPESRKLSFVHWEPGAKTIRNVHGILEPLAKRPVPIQDIQFIVVPGAAFSLSGHRLGSGGGYYDRLLAGPHPPCSGLAFDEQIAVRLPRSPHDRPVDCVVTPSRVIPRVK
jgi:5-formyltetrahydrofolate cyclo-ligase